MIFESKSEIYISFRKNVQKIAADRENIGMREIDKCGCGFEDVSEFFK